MPKITGVHPLPHINMRKCTSTQMSVSSDAYHANDLVGTPLIFTNVAAYPGATANIKRIVIADVVDQNAALDLVFMSSAPSTSVDHGAFTIPEANLTDVVHVVSLVSSDYSGFSGNMYASISKDIPFISDSDNSLYCYAVTRATPTYDSLTIYVTLWVDVQQ